MKCIFILLIAFVYAEDALVFVIEFSRHGARYPSNANFSWVTESMGLTSAGMRQHYLFGTALRNRYINAYKFLDENYNPDQVIYRVSQTTRTLSSIQAQLSGMYPYGYGSTINDNQKELAVPPNKFNYTDWIKDLDKFSVKYGVLEQSQTPQVSRA